MAYSTPSNRSTGDLITSAIWNQDVVSNSKVIDPSARGGGDVLYANSTPDGFDWLDASANPGKFLRFNAAGNALEAAEVPSLVVADAFEWGSKVANRYVANFASGAILNNTVYGDLADVGWLGSPTAPPTTQTTGDLDSASDPAGSDQTNAISIGNNVAFGSPPVIGTWGLLEALERVIGTRPTTITCWFVFNMTNTIDQADTAGVGVSASGDTIPGGGTNGIWINIGATNFEVLQNTTATDTGVAKDTNKHIGEIVIDVAAGEYVVKLDGTTVKASAALLTDQFPLRMHAGKGSTGADPRISQWGVNYD